MDMALKQKIENLRKHMMNNKFDYEVDHVRSKIIFKESAVELNNKKGVWFISNDINVIMPYYL